MVYRYQHIHLICSNLDLMENFFTGALGAKVKERKKFGKADGASLDLNGITINLRVLREDEVITGDSSQRHYGYDHLGLEVENLDAAYRDLKEKGFTFTNPPHDSGTTRSAFFKGPDNQ